MFYTKQCCGHVFISHQQENLYLIQLILKCGLSNGSHKIPIVETCRDLNAQQRDYSVLHVLGLIL